MATVSAQHAATFGKSIAEQQIIYSFAAKETIPTKRKTFEAMVAKFDRFVRRMDAICHRHGEKRMSEWMDNQDVCRMLNISPRTLQTLRDNGTLAYSQINHKTYYRPEDVKRIVSIVEDRRKEARFKGRTI